MNRETLSYISRRMRGDNSRNEDTENRTDNRMEYENRNENRSENRSENRMEMRNHYPEYPEYEEQHPISSRYYSSTNTYRAEGVVEGRIEHGEPYEGGKRQIGFSRGGRKGDQDFLYKLEESLEEEIADIMYYSELAMEAHTKGHTEFAEGFYEVAKEKLTCAEHLRHRLIKHGTYDPSKQSEIEDRYDRAKHLFRRL